jgi:hypothetical protein
MNIIKPEKSGFFYKFENMKNRLVLLFMWFFTLSATAQRISNKFILQLKPGTNLEDAHVKLQNFGQVKWIDKSYRIVSVTVPNENTETVSKVLVLVLLKNLDFVQTAQKTNKVEKRVVPNDKLYPNQQYLHYLNVEKVWNVKQGGVDAYGDTIVVAIIDDGIDTSHKDLIPNLWHNYSETPWNGVDDDDNGYVDDFYGWNGGDEDNRIFNDVSASDGHGTSVAGIVGARGNDDLGIAGMNWNVKLMAIHCFATDDVDFGAGILRSMIYAIRMKEVYVSSNKSKGANIVSINMSIGIDNGLPEDAPIWCSLYDSLGKVGIVSITAVTNKNVDVDVVGDIPTRCPSKFIVTVAACDYSDQHISSGYSTTYVDLASYGKSVYTSIVVNKNPTNPYKYSNGTSYASPQVAGGIALLESVACKKFLDLKKANFDSAMSLYILWLDSSSVRNSTLKDYTLFGGRFDANGMYEEMMKWCSYGGNDNLPSKESSNAVIVAPNPIKGNTLQLTNFTMGIVNYNLIDIQGRIVKSWKSLERNVALEIPDFTSGLYILNWSSSTGEWGSSRIELTK